MKVPALLVVGTRLVLFMGCCYEFVDDKGPGIQRQYFYPRDFQISLNSDISRRGKGICHIPDFLGQLGTPIICKLHGCSIFYFLDFCLYLFKTIKSIFHFQPKYNYRPPYLSGSNSKQGIIGVFAFSARSYIAEVRGVIMSWTLFDKCF